MKDNKEVVNVPLRLLEELWDKLEECTDKHSMGDSWQSDELRELVRKVEAILNENDSKVVND